MSDAIIVLYGSLVFCSDLMLLGVMLCAREDRQGVQSEAIFYAVMPNHNQDTGA